MKRTVGTALAIALWFAPLASNAQQGDLEDGFNLMDEGARLLLRGLQEEMQPLMEDLAIEMEPKLRDLAESLMPLMEDFSAIVGDLDMYHPPEKLPNGDIILRRKTPGEKRLPDASPEDDEVDI